MTTRSQAPIVAFERFPFWTGLRDPDDVADLPTHLPFRLAIDEQAAVPRVMLSDAIGDALREAYAAGSLLSTPLGEGPLAAARMEEMLGGLLAAFGDDVAGCRFLEIGCGYGHLLNELKLRGAVVVGCEIGPQGAIAEGRFGIPIVREDLRPGLFGEPFDCIFSYGCLEHIVGLADFLAAARASLADGGLFFHSVPNSDGTFAAVRIDDLCHEHVNYFTAENGARLFAAQGFGSAGAKPTEAGNELHIWGYLDAGATVTWPGAAPGVLDAERAALKVFAAACVDRLTAQTAAVEQMLARGESVGFYAGGRTVGSAVGRGGELRYYDGDKAKHGKCWLAGMQPIRDPMTLRADPVDTLIVCPDHYFPAIRDHLVNSVGLPAGLRVIRLGDLQ